MIGWTLRRGKPYLPRGVGSIRECFAGRTARHGPPVWSEETFSVFACICHAVTDREVTEHIRDGASTEEEVGDACGAGTGCGSCLDRICEMISAIHPEHGRVPRRVPLGVAV
jgi:bacterioferritin-associated ferredoxin